MLRDTDNIALLGPFGNGELLKLTFLIGVAARAYERGEEPPHELIDRYMSPEVKAHLDASFALERSESYCALHSIQNRVMEIFPELIDKDSSKLYPRFREERVGDDENYVYSYKHHDPHKVVIPEVYLNTKSIRGYFGKAVKALKKQRRLEYARMRFIVKARDSPFGPEGVPEKRFNEMGLEKKKEYWERYGKDWEGYEKQYGDKNLKAALRFADWFVSDNDFWEAVIEKPLHLRYRDFSLQATSQILSFNPISAREEDIENPRDVKNNIYHFNLVDGAELFCSDTKRDYDTTIEDIIEADEAFSYKDEKDNLYLVARKRDIIVELGVDGDNLSELKEFAAMVLGKERLAREDGRVYRWREDESLETYIENERERLSASGVTVSNVKFRAADDAFRYREGVNNYLCVLSGNELWELAYPKRTKKIDAKTIISRMMQNPPSLELNSLRLSRENIQSLEWTIYDELTVSGFEDKKPDLTLDPHPKYKIERYDNKFKDKETDYNAIHIDLLMKPQREGELPRYVEIQIRTPDSHTQAEVGKARHEDYIESTTDEDLLEEVGFLQAYFQGEKEIIRGKLRRHLNEAGRIRDSILISDEPIDRLEDVILIYYEANGMLTALGDDDKTKVDKIESMLVETPNEYLKHGGLNVFGRVGTAEKMKQIIEDAMLKCPDILNQDEIDFIHFQGLVEYFISAGDRGKKGKLFATGLIGLIEDYEGKYKTQLIKDSRYIGLMGRFEEAKKEDVKKSSGYSVSDGMYYPVGVDKTYCRKHLHGITKIGESEGEKLRGSLDVFLGALDVPGLEDDKLKYVVDSMVNVTQELAEKQ